MFGGRTDSGAWVMKVAGESSSLVLKNSHQATLKCNVLINQMEAIALLLPLKRGMWHQ